MNALFEFVLELYQSWGDGWPEKFLVSLMTLLLILVTTLVGWLLLYLVDTVNRPVYKQAGKIEGHCFTPAHMQTTYVCNGKTMMPRTQWIQNSYTIGVSLDDGRSGAMGCGAEFFATPDGTSVKAVYKVGRITGKIYLQSIETTK